MVRPTLQEKVTRLVKKYCSHIPGFHVRCPRPLALMEPAHTPD